MGKTEVRRQLKAHNGADCLLGRKIRPVIAQGPVLSVCILMPAKALWLLEQVLWLFLLQQMPLADGTVGYMRTKKKKESY